MLIGHWFTSKWNNRPRTVVKVLFCSFKNVIKGWDCKKLELLYESNYCQKLELLFESNKQKIKFLTLSITELAWL